MFKLFASFFIGLIFLLGCSSSDTPVTCTSDGDQLVIYSEDGQVTSVVFEINEDISTMSEGELEILTGLLDIMEGDYVIEGGYLTATMTIEADQLALMGIPLGIDAAVSQFEAEGAICQ